MKTYLQWLTTSLLTLTLVACSNSTPSNSTPANSSNANNPNFVNAASKCKNMGGKWTRGGTMYYGCLRPAKDAGKTCTDSAQCEFHCNARKGEKPQPGQPATGQCQTTNSYKGCHIEIKNGIAKPLFCSKI